MTQARPSHLLIEKEHLRGLMSAFSFVDVLDSLPEANEEMMRMPRPRPRPHLHCCLLPNSGTITPCPRELSVSF